MINLGHLFIYLLIYINFLSLPGCHCFLLFRNIYAVKVGGWSSVGSGCVSVFLVVARQASQLH